MERNKGVDRMNIEIIFLTILNWLACIFGLVLFFLITNIEKRIANIINNEPNNIACPICLASGKTVIFYKKGNKSTQEIENCKLCKGKGYLTFSEYNEYNLNKKCGRYIKLRRLKLGYDIIEFASLLDLTVSAFSKAECGGEKAQEVFDLVVEKILNDEIIKKVSNEH